MVPMVSPTKASWSSASVNRRMIPAGATLTSLTLTKILLAFCLTGKPLNASYVYSMTAQNAELLASNGVSLLPSPSHAIHHAQLMPCWYHRLYSFGKAQSEYVHQRATVKCEAHHKCETLMAAFGSWLPKGKIVPQTW